MATRTIFGDVYLNFGKYKGKAATDVLASDPGYFLWLQEAGQANLAPDVSEVVMTWAKNNKAEAAKTVASARKVRKPTLEVPDGTGKSAVSATPPWEAAKPLTPPTPPAPKAQPENWGCW